MTVREGVDQFVNDGAPREGASASDAGQNIGLFERLKEWFNDSQDHFHDSRKEQEEAFAFVAGHQWSEDDSYTLSQQNRPVITFNRVGPFIDAICGIQITNRQETRFIPRQIGTAGVAELLSGAAKWVRDTCDCEDEESSAFRDMIICGMGWMQTVLSYDEDPDGLILCERVDPLEMFPDPAARKDNLSDARFVFRVKDVPVQVARDMAPGHDDEDLDATWARDTASEAESPHNARLAPFYVIDQSGQTDRERQHVRLVEVEWWEFEVSYRVQDPRTGKRFNAKPAEHAELKRRAGLLGMPLQSVKDRKKVYHRALLGNVILTQSPGAGEGGFTYKCMTGKRDPSKNVWYGLVRGMIDPARWANKWLSQILYILNSNAKGGMLAEQDAFENTSDAEDTWADPQAITWTAPGALQNGKIQPKPAPQMPPQLESLLQFAIGALPQVTGVNPEMLGQVDHEQAGILEMHRTQRGVNVLSQFFDAFRRYQKEQGRLLLWMIRTFISDGRLIKIGGQEDAQYVPLVHQPGLAEYDVSVDDTPWAPNQKERTWGMLQQLFPVISRMNLPPQAMLEMMKYSPLPEQLVSKLGQMIQQQMQAAQQNPAMQGKTAIDQAKAGDLQAAAAVKHAQAGKIGAETQRIATETGTLVTQHQADIESARASAIANLTKAGVAQQGAGLQQAIAAADTLLRTHAQMHDQAMDVAGMMLPQVQPGAPAGAPPQPPVQGTQP